MTLEAVVERGQIRLPAALQIPDNTKVYVVVPDLQVEGSAPVWSPRLMHPEQAADFVLEVIEEDLANAF